jgi:hypothetical protein
VNPTSTPDNSLLPGVDDYYVIIPVTGPDGTDGEVRFRLPAGDDDTALLIGRHVATHIDQVIRHRHTTDGEPLWKVAVSDVMSGRIDIDTPSADELAAELDHWKRIVTALARKLPAMLIVNTAEYESADTSDLAMVPAGDNAMMLVTPNFYSELADAMPTPDATSADESRQEPMGAGRG